MPVDAPFPSPLPSREKGALLRRRGAQRGQAIVLIAVMLAVLIGMAALAIDGARAYSLRRDLQDAVDGAALAAGDTLQQTGSYTQAEQAASNSFGQNMALYAAPGCTPGYGNPGAASYVVTCTYSDGTVLTQTVMSLGAAGSRFMLSATKSLSLQFGRILTNGASPNLTAGATAAVNNLLYTPTLAALNQAGCGGKPGIAMSLGASGTLTVNGTIVASGAISVPGGANLRVAGDIYARCQVTVPGLVTTVCYPGGTTPPCTFPSVAGLTKSGYAYADPNYPAPPVTAGSRGIPGNDVVISPGTYAANPNFGNRRCYFLAGGVYKFQGGYSNNGALVSNELKPPDEPNPANNQQAANPQFWNIDNVNCAGAFDVQVSNGGGSNLGTWGVEVTSTRSDLYSGTNYPRESAPSRCQSFAVHSAQTVQLKVSNVPGATSYNIYLSSNGCNGPFGLVGNLPVTGAVQNDNTRYCPFDQNGNGNNGTSNGNNGNGNGNGNNGNNNCSLGSETLSVPAVVLPTLPLPNILALWGTSGAYPPDNETPPIAAGLPNQNADRGVPPAGDKANENQCSAIGGTAVTCPGPVTPGAVSYYIPNGSCLTDPNGGDNYVFSGYQYNWMAVYEPGVGQVEIENTCANVMGASTASAYIGLVYMPAASLTIPTSNGFRTEATGGVIADTITFTGTLPTMTGISDFMPVPPAARLVS